MKDDLRIPDMQLKYALKKEIEFLLNMRALCYKNPALFVTCCHCVRMKRDTLWRDFKKASEISGINKNVTSHILRHTFCTNLLINGAGIAHIQKLAGHEDINTTIRHYASLDDKSIIEARQRYLNYDI